MEVHTVATRPSPGSNKSSRAWPTLVHGPIHASWLNQVEIYFSIVQGKVLTPNDFSGLHQLTQRLLDVQSYWESTAKPSEWKFTKTHLATLLSKLSGGRPKIR